MEENTCPNEGVNPCSSDHESVAHCTDIHWLACLTFILLVFFPFFSEEVVQRLLKISF